MLVPEKLLEGDKKIKRIHQVTDSDKKIGIKIVLCSHPETQIILSVNLVEGIR